MLWLQKNFQWDQWLQLPVRIICGLMIDRLMSWWNTRNIQNYSLQILLCLISYFMTAIGVGLVMKANLVFLAGEDLHWAISKRFNFDHGKYKTYGDIVLILIAMTSSGLILGKWLVLKKASLLVLYLLESLLRYVYQD